MTLRDDILAQTDIVDLVSRYVSLKKTGKNRSGLCPFHKEKTPSFTVAEDKQIFKCFGCGKGGNAITFQMEIEKIDYRDSIQLLAKNANIDISKYQKDPVEMNKQQEGREKLKLLNKRAQARFQSKFTPETTARSYIRESRKLTEETITNFGIGYTPDSHYGLITHLKEKGFSTEDIILAGLAKQGNSGEAYAFFRDRVTFPIYDHIGNIVGFGARALHAEQSPKYLNTTETPLYDKSSILFGLDKAKLHLAEFGSLIVVEGYMDVIALHQYGLPIGIATCGTALTPQHTKLIKRHTDHVIFAFDNDTAGFEAAVRGLKVAYQQDLFPKVFQFPNEFKDIDEYLTNSAQQVTSTLLSEQSIDGFTFVLRKLDHLYEIDNPVERKKILTICFELLAYIEDYTILVLYLDQMAKLFQTSTDTLLNQLKGFLKQQRTPPANSTSSLSSSSTTVLDNKYLLAGLYYQNFAQKFFNDQLPPSIIQHLEAVQELSTYFPGSLVEQIASHANIDETEQQHLLEAHLRREQQTDKLATDKKALTLLAFLQKQLHILEKIVLKSKQLSDDQKQQIIAQLRTLKQ